MSKHRARPKLKPIVADPLPVDDAELVRLWRKLRPLWAREHEVRNAGDKVLEAAMAKCSAVADQIERLTPTALDGFRVKALAIMWCRNGLDEFPEGIAQDTRLVRSIIRDLIHLTANGPAAATWPGFSRRAAATLAN
jgi:hypothetical protein